MDDLKVVLYIVVAIIWVIYNNYKKINDAARKRDPSKPPAEVIQENWPKPQPAPARRTLPKPGKVVEKQSSVPARPILERQPLPQRQPMRRQPLASRSRPTSPVFQRAEGGSVKPSKVVQFEEQEIQSEQPNALLTALLTTDARQGIIWAEVLKRPYS